MAGVEKISLTWGDVMERAEGIARRICEVSSDRVVKTYPIPRGGIPAALAVAAAKKTSRVMQLELVEDPIQADIYIDDILDSGATKVRYQELNPLPFYVLVDKQKEGMQWWEFPWERMSDETAGPEENVRRLIEFIGDDPKREGLRETPARVLRSYGELFVGYNQKPEEVLTFFEDGVCDEMVVIRNVEFYSTCEHHMLPFFGRAHIAYIPDGRVVGLSKLARLLEVFARRLQIQERICQQVTTALDDLLKPKGSACVLEAKHLCMTGRGVGKQHSEMVTSSLTGVFLEKGNDARQEFLSMVR